MLTGKLTVKNRCSSERLIRTKSVPSADDSLFQLIILKNRDCSKSQLPQQQATPRTTRKSCAILSYIFVVWISLLYVLNVCSFSLCCSVLNAKNGGSDLFYISCVWLGCVRSSGQMFTWQDLEITQLGKRENICTAKRRKKKLGT